MFQKRSCVHKNIHEFYYQSSTSYIDDFIYMAQIPSSYIISIVYIILNYIPSSNINLMRAWYFDTCISWYKCWYANKIIIYITVNINIKYCISMATSQWFISSTKPLLFGNHLSTIDTSYSHNEIISFWKSHKFNLILLY